MIGKLHKFAKLWMTLAITTVVSACQVQPLHQTNLAFNNRTEISEALRSIEISNPESHIEQIIINELQFGLSGTHKATGELPYTLDIRGKKEIRSVGITDVDFGPAAFFITISADYVLKDNRVAAPIAQGTQSATAGFDRVDQEFANINSEEDADKRASKVVANKLRQALILALEHVESN